MADDTYYITPHEAALAVVATAMKKARLRFDTLIINSIIGGILFSAGGMLHVAAGAENPTLNELNPGIVHFIQGMVYPIGLFYVIMMGAELYNSNILYFSVGVCRGAVSILDLLISWSLSWLFNMVSNLFVCYVVMHLSGIDQTENYSKGAIEMGLEKIKVPFIQTFIRGCAANWCVCLAVYLQLLAKPIHVKLFVMALPIFTFVSMGFNHVVADMFIVPNALFIWLCPTSQTNDVINTLRESSENYDKFLDVGTYIWRTLVPATLGNAVGGSLFGIIVVWYSHLVVVERDRKMLNLPAYDAKDEQPELATDSRVVRVTPSVPQESVSSESSTDFEKPEDLNPTRYRPTSFSEDMHHLQPALTSSSRRSTQHSLRSPPGVFPVLGMGEPLTRERTIAGELGNAEEEDIENITGRRTSFNDASSLRSRASALKNIQQIEEEEYKGYNARENTLGETLKRVVTHSNRKPSDVSDIESGLSFTPAKRNSSFGSVITERGGRIFKTISHRKPSTAQELHDHLRRHSITTKAANASDNIAGIDSYDIRDRIHRPPPVVRKGSSSRVAELPTVSSNDLSAEASIDSDLERDDDEDEDGPTATKN